MTALFTKPPPRCLALVLACVLLLACAACGNNRAEIYTPGDLELFEHAAQISSDQFLLAEKNMTIRQVMDTLGETAYMIGQGPSAMYYIVDGTPLKIDFVNLIDEYPFSGQEMKMYWDVFGAVTFKTIQAENLLRLRKGMTPADIAETLGNTIDVGSGRHIVKYTIWDGLALTEFTFNSGGEGLPCSGKEIHGMFLNGETGVSW